MRWLLTLLLWLALAPAQGHEVREQVQQAPATVVTLRYADDEPFSFERYELFADGQEQPVYTGRTDAQGRLVFLPDARTRWRLRSFSSDGHGVDFRFEVQAGAVAATVAAAPGYGRPLRIAAGLAVIAALYGMLRWYVRHRRRGTP